MKERSEREQHLRNEVGQLTHKVHRMMEQRQEMQRDLVLQRDAMRAALNALNIGDNLLSKQLLQRALDRRDETREPRKTKCPTTR